MNNYSIGVVGGMGSYATLHFFKRLLVAFPAEREWDRPRIIIDNYCTMPSRVLAALKGERRQELVGCLSSSVRGLMDYNVDRIILACNTSHLFLEEVFLEVPEARKKVLNIIHALSEGLADLDVKNVALLATEGTIKSGIYNIEFKASNINMEVLGGGQFSDIRRIIEDVKQNKITRDTISSFKNLMLGFRSKNIILGCTELPVIYEKCFNDNDIASLSVYDPLDATINVLKKTIN